MDANCGNILSVNLSDTTLETKPFPVELKKHYLGGRGAEVTNGDVIAIIPPVGGG